MEERGGINQLHSSRDFPCNRPQIYNAKRCLNNPTFITSTAKDVFLDLFLKAKQEQGEGRFTTFSLRHALFPESVVFLTTNQYLLDVQ